jgi:hypothetical protein
MKEDAADAVLFCVAVKVRADLPNNPLYLTAAASRRSKGFWLSSRRGR